MQTSKNACLIFHSKYVMVLPDTCSQFAVNKLHSSNQDSCVAVDAMDVTARVATGRVDKEGYKQAQSRHL